MLEAPSRRGWQRRLLSGRAVPAWSMVLGHSSHHSQARGEAARSSGMRLPLAALRMMPGMMLPISQVGNQAQTVYAGNRMSCCHACSMALKLSEEGQRLQQAVVISAGRGSGKGVTMLRSELAPSAACQVLIWMTHSHVPAGRPLWTCHSQGSRTSWASEIWRLRALAVWMGRSGLVPPLQRVQVPTATLTASEPCSGRAGLPMHFCMCPALRLTLQPWSSCRRQ